MGEQPSDVVPGWEGSVGPFRKDYGKPHVYARNVQSGSGNCVCGAHLGHRRHVQAAPGIDIPDRMRDSGHSPGEAIRARARTLREAAEVEVPSTRRPFDQRAPKLIVLARTYLRAQDEASRQGLRPRSWLYVRDPEAMRGYSRARVWALQGWDEGRTAGELDRIRYAMAAGQMEWVSVAGLEP